MDTVWIVVVVLGAILVIVGLGRFVWSLRPQEGMGGTSPTPLEMLGWIGLTVTALVGAGLAVLVAVEGTSFFDNDVARGIFWLLLLIGTGAWVGSWWLINRRNGSVVVDERDRAILARSLAVESVVVILLLVTWTITLTEVFRDDGVMPLEYLQLIFWSIFIGGAFGRSAGIILGYRREITIDA